MNADTPATPKPNPSEVTVLLQAWKAGDQAAGEELVPLVYNELHRISRSFLRKERANHTLQATALVNEAYMKLAEQNKIDWQNRAHFLSVAAQMMRRILINYWKERNAQKRGGGAVVLTLEEGQIGGKGGIDLEVLNDGLEKLAERDERKARLIELKFFGGLTEEELAEVLGVSVPTIRRDWRLARVWLYRYLGEEGRSS